MEVVKIIQNANKLKVRLTSHFSQMINGNLEMYKFIEQNTGATVITYHQMYIIQVFL